MFAEYVKEKYGKDIERCSDKQLYAALLKMVNEMAAKKEKTEGKKKLYYISAEFLIGKLLSNNLINLGIYDEVRQELKKAGKKLSNLEEMEPEPSLGNGGLGRLAACFLDSIATLGLPGDGIGLNYHFGLFRQVFKKRMQKELPNPWMEDDSWLIKSDRKYSVSLGKYNVVSIMYDILVTGYDNRTNVLHLFDINSVDEKIVDKGIDFDKKDIILLDYEGEKFHDDSDLGILFDWYTTPPTWKLRYNKRTFGVSKTEYGFSDDYQLEDVFEWSVDYLKTVDSNVIGIKINCGKLHDIVTKENIKDFLINDNDSFVIYYKVDSLEQYYTYSKNGFKYTNDNFDNINSQVLKKFEFINKDIENKGVYLTTSDLEFSRNSWESFASYYYDTKIGNITIEEKGKAIG